MGIEPLLVVMLIARLAAVKPDGGQMSRLLRPGNLNTINCPRAGLLLIPEYVRTYESRRAIYRVSD